MDLRFYTKCARGYTNFLQHHLEELSWYRSVSNSEHDIMADFWNAVSLVHDSEYYSNKIFLF